MPNGLESNETTRTMFGSLLLSLHPTPVVCRSMASELQLEVGRKVKGGDRRTGDTSEMGDLVLFEDLQVT